MSYISDPLGFVDLTLMGDSDCKPPEKKDLITPPIAFYLNKQTNKKDHNYIE